MKAFVFLTISLAMFTEIYSAKNTSKGPKLHIVEETIPVEGDIPPHQYTLTYLAVVISYSVAIRIIVDLCNLNVSCMLILMATGLLSGLMGHYLLFVGDYLEVVYNTDAASYMVLTFPYMIFKLTLCMDIHTTMRALPQIILISTVGVSIMVLFTGLLAMAVLNEKEIRWTIPMAFTFGIIATPLDIGESLKRLRDIEGSKHLVVLLEGESVMGVAYLIILINVLYAYLDGRLTNWVSYAATISLQFTAGPLIGIVAGLFIARLLSKLCSEKISLMCLTMSVPMLIFYLFFNSQYISSTLILIAVGLILNKERTSFTKELNNFLVYNWEFIDYLANSAIFFTIGVMSLDLFLENTEIVDFTAIMVTYVVSIFGRFLAFIVMAPILSRVSYGLTFRSMVIVVWSGVKGSLCLLFSLLMYSLRKYQIGEEDFVIHMTGLVVLTHLLNISSMNLMVKVFGLGELSVARKTNMNTCIKKLMSRRNHMISMLKMDRFLVESNWVTVLENTYLNNPHHVKLKDSDDEDDYTLGYRFTVCPDCKLEIADEPSAKEFIEMTKEARMRILKAKRISYTKQYENGMISKNSHRALIQAIEIAMDSESYLIEVDGLIKIFNRQNVFHIIRKLMLRLVKQTTKELNIKPPCTYWRRKCYHVITSKWFDPVIYSVIILNVIPIAIEIAMEVRINSPLGHSLAIINIIFFLIYVVEFVFKVAGYSHIYICRDGFGTYFRSWWNVFDFAVILAASCDLVLDAMEYMPHVTFDKNQSLLARITLAIRLLRLFRLLRLLRVCNAYYPRIIRHLDSRIDFILAKAYDIGKGFVAGEEEVLDMLNQMIDNVDIREDMRARMENDKTKIAKQLGIVQKYRPWIAITVKTRQAIMTVLNSMSDIVYELKISGWVDDVEHMKLDESLQKQFKYVKKIRKVQPSPPQVIFKEVPWMANDQAIINFLYDNVQTKNFDPGEVICSIGQMSDGIYILVTGLFKLKYSPIAKTLEDLKELGELPIIDYIGSSKFEDRFMDYIVSGNSIGELSFLTNRMYCCTITADTTSQAYLLTHDVMKEATTKSTDSTQGLVCRLWKFISMRLATALLMTVPAYQSYKQEKIRYMLERSFVPDLSRFKTLVLNEMMEDVILIEGVVADSNTLEFFVAPCNIPRTTKKLTLIREIDGKFDNREPKLLIVPQQDATDHEIMETGEMQSELLSITSSKCLQHQMMKKRKRRKSKTLKGRHKSVDRKVHPSAHSLPNASAEFRREQDLVSGTVEPSIEERSETQSKGGATTPGIRSPDSWKQIWQATSKEDVPTFKTLQKKSTPKEVIRSLRKHKLSTHEEKKKSPKKK